MQYVSAWVLKKDIVSEPLNYGRDEKSALQAKFDAQKIAFAPIMFQAAKALRDLDILDCLARHRKKGGITRETVASQLSLSVYGVKVLLEAGLSLEMVRVEDDHWFLTKTGHYIAGDELTKVNMDFTQDVNYLGFQHLQAAIKSGKPEGLKVFGAWDTVYEGLSEMPEQFRKSWFGFDHYYSDQAFPEVLPLLFDHQPKRILDVGGNTGKFSLCCTDFDPDVDMTILDLPGQCKDAEKKIAEAHRGERIHTVALNLLDQTTAFPDGFDVVWMSQFLDCFSQDEIVSLLSRGREALNDSGALYILETYWDKQKYEASTYSLHATSLYFTAIANGNSQMYHSSDMIDLVDQAGLRVETAYENLGVSHTLFRCLRK